MAQGFGWIFRWPNFSLYNRRFWEKEMNLYEYNLLDIDKRANILWQHGILITDHIDQERGCLLYTLFDFYVETVLDYKTNKITEVTPFAKGERLDKYLPQVRIDDLKS